MTFTRTEKREAGKGSSHPLFLSLFILLLAFFILLNALSTVEQGRSNRVLESVQEAFPSAYRGQIRDSMLEAEAGRAIGETVRAAIGAVFREELPVAELTADPSGSPLFVSFPARLVYAPAAGGITPVTERVAARLAPIVNGRDGRSALKLQILFGIDAGADADDRSDSIFRASEVVRAFLRAEIQPDTLSTGLEVADPTKVRLVFRGATSGEQP